MNEKSTTENYKKMAWWLIAIGVIIMVLAGVLFLKDSFCWFAPINSEEFSRFGSFSEGLVGVLFSLAGILLVLATLNEQKEQFEKMQTQAQKQQVESHFFQLLKLNQEEKQRIKFESNLNDSFGSLLENYGTILESTRINLKQFELKEKDQINISYLIFFFGTEGDEMKKSLKSVLHDAKIKSDIIDIIMTGGLSVIRQGIITSEPTFVSTPGFSNKIGHYFRQLYHLVNYISENEILDSLEKTFYIRILRTHMSDQEQALFFFNSLSFLGRNWKKQTICKYKLIHNAPDSLFFGVNRYEYYPAKF